LDDCGKDYKIRNRNEAEKPSVRVTLGIAKPPERRVRLFAKGCLGCGEFFFAFVVFAAFG